MARVIVIEPREEIADALVAALSESQTVALCEKANLQEQSLSAIFRRIEKAAIDTVVYSPSMAGSRSLSPNVAQTKTVITHCASTQVRKVILISSAMIYGASPHNQGLIPESRVPICLSRSRLARAWMDVETLVAEGFDGAGELTILRPAATLANDGDY